MPDAAFVNGGGVRTNLLAGNVTRADLINVNPFNNQLCYTQVTGQDLLDALELSARAYPKPLGDFLQVSEGLTFTIRTDIDSPVILNGNEFAGFKDGAERRVRRVTLHGKAIDPQPPTRWCAIRTTSWTAAGHIACLRKTPSRFWAWTTMR